MPFDAPGRSRVWVRRMIGLGLLALLLKSTDTGLTGLLVGIAVASVPVPLYIALALWLDRFEKEPPRLLWWSFFWGATIANFAALFLNTANTVIAELLWGEAAAGFLGSVVSAPIVEECGKGFMVYLLYKLCRDEFDNVVDGVIYASMVALGFAMAENIGYYGSALNEEGIAGLHTTVIVRGLMSPFAHPFFTSMTGIGLGLARQTRDERVRRFAPLAGLGAAMLLHALWNSVEGMAYIAVYFLIMVPLFIGVLVLVSRSLGQESRLLQRYLEPELTSGHLSPEQVASLVTIKGRRGALWRSLRAGGFRARGAELRRHQAASELAFYRDRVERGVVEADPALEASLRRQVLDDLSKFA